jgi:uncharacterized membrane protein YgaE (UPF0421/DUF939 family)
MTASSTNQLAVKATLRCLTGCTIGEVTGMVIGMHFGLHDFAIIVLSISINVMAMQSSKASALSAFHTKGLWN